MPTVGCHNRPERGSAVQRAQHLDFNQDVQQSSAWKYIKYYPQADARFDRL
jgi:hypothetical protein